MEKEKMLLEDYIDHPGLYLIAGVKSVGKTTLVSNLAMQFKENFDKTVLYYHSDKSGKPRVERDEKIRVHNMSEDELFGIWQITYEIEWQIKNSLSLIIIDDYTFLARTENPFKFEATDRERLIHILTKLDTIADIYQVPIILTTGINDDFIYPRKNREPLITDVPYYETVSSFAKIIIMHMEQLYDPETEEKGIARFSLYRAPGAERVVSELAWIPEEGRFCNLERSRALGVRPEEILCQSM